ncbi:MAG: hypothetical protein MZV64_70020 [Ignavibacteriales bacterium]|nr:hypothetical protein [Ignavibacteriales bacterium]
MVGQPGLHNRERNKYIGVDVFFTDASNGTVVGVGVQFLKLQTAEQIGHSKQAEQGRGCMGYTLLMQTTVGLLVTRV